MNHEDIYHFTLGLSAERERNLTGERKPWLYERRETHAPSLHQCQILAHYKCCKDVFCEKGNLLEAMQLVERAERLNARPRRS